MTICMRVDCEITQGNRWDEAAGGHVSVQRGCAPKGPVRVVPIQCVVSETLEKNLLEQKLSGKMQQKTAAI